MGFAKTENGEAVESGGKKVERDPVAEPDSATGRPAGDEPGDVADGSDEPGQGVGDVNTSGQARPESEPAVVVAPPAMTPLQVAAAGPAAAVRVHCDARCGREWCLYAGADIPADEDGEPFADPREAVMAAAGCHGDPPTCPGATDTTRPDGVAGVAPSGVAEARAAVFAVSSTPDLVAAGAAGVAVAMSGGARPGGLAAALRAEAAQRGELATAHPAPQPVQLTTAEVHGITAAGVDPSVAQIAAVPYAVGGEVLGMLRALGVATAGLEEVLMERTPDPEPDPDDDSPETDPDEPGPGETGDA